MARDAVTITDIAKAGVATPAGVTIDPANDCVISAGGDLQGVFIRVTNTHTSAHNVTIKAGDNPPAVLQGQGDKVIEVPADTGDILIDISDSARYAQNDGTVLIDFATGHAGKISAFRKSD